MLDMCFEPACARLHDSRPRAARELFQSILIPEHRPSEARVLALMGNGLALNVWRRYAAADHSLSKALHEAEKLGDALLQVTSRLLWTMNCSDMGLDVDLDPLFSAEPPGVTPQTRTLIEVTRAYVGARVHFRSGQRALGIELCESVLSQPAFRTVAPIPRGRMLRMAGILHSVVGAIRERAAVPGRRHRGVPPVQLCRR